MEETLCVVCQVPAKQSCSSCHSSFYCSKECQKRDWKTHKSSCIPYDIKIHPVYGRYVVANRDIAAGEVIMKEVAVALGPKLGSKPLCLGCHRAVNCSYYCSKCCYPLCSEKCEKTVIHEAECQVLSKGKPLSIIENQGEPNPAYECILPLRCLMTKYTDPKKWKAINSLQGHTELMTETKKNSIEANIVNYFRIHMNFKGVDSNEIINICGILHTNSFEVLHNGSAVEGVYPKVAMMAHNCVPNSENIFNGDTQAVVRATVPIPKGAAITTTYVNLIWSSLPRRAYLLSGKYFNCDCQRCSDPRELGTDLSTLLCSKCGGHVLSVSPLDRDADWCCQDCSRTIPGKDVEKTQKMLYKAFIARDRTTINPLEDLIKSCEDRLHPKHQIVVEAKFSFIKFCGNHPAHRYKDIPKVQLQKKISYCRELMTTADSIFPGRSQFRGFLLFELHASLRAMANKLLSFGDMNNECVQSYLDESENCLKETKSIFYFENEMKNRGFDDKLSLLNKDFEYSIK